MIWNILIINNPPPPRLLLWDLRVHYTQWLSFITPLISQSSSKQLEGSQLAADYILKLLSCYNYCKWITREYSSDLLHGLLLHLKTANKMLSKYERKLRHVNLHAGYLYIIFRILIVVISQLHHKRIPLDKSITNQKNDKPANT